MPSFAKTSFATGRFATVICTPLLFLNAADAQVSSRQDSQGRTIGWTEPQGRSAAFELTADGQIARVRASGGFLASQGFDQAGRVISIDRPSGGRVTLNRDAEGKITSIADPLGREYRFVYDSSKRLLMQIDPTGQILQYGQNPARNLFGHRASDGSRILFRYNNAGKLIAADDGTFTVRRSFDAAGRLTRLDYPTLRKGVQYSYDQRGRKVSMVDPDGRRVAYEYGGNGLTALIAPNAGRFEFTRDAKGRVLTLRYPNGVIGSWTYNDSGRVIAILYHAADGSYVAGTSYAYDDRSRLVAQRDSSNAVTSFEYDEAGQLTRETGPRGTITYRYGSGGNRTAVDRNGDVITHRHDGADQLLQAGFMQYAYDANGRLAERSTPSFSERFQFDAANQLKRVTSSDGIDISYQYAPTGERISRSVGRQKTYFVYDRFALLQELAEDLRPLATYVHAPGIDRPLAMVRDGKIYFYHADRAGSIIALTDDRGGVVARYDYDAFGLARTDGTVTGNSFMFTGREWEPELGLYYYRARYYDPAVGRFLSPDPLAGRIIDPIELNPYLYVNNNPVRFRDPLGLTYDEHDLDFADDPLIDTLVEDLLWEHDYLKRKLNSDFSEYFNPKDAAQAKARLQQRLAQLELEMAELGISPPNRGSGVSAGPKPGGAAQDPTVTAPQQRPNPGVADSSTVSGPTPGRGTPGAGDVGDISSSSLWDPSVDGSLDNWGSPDSPSSPGDVASGPTAEPVRPGGGGAPTDTPNAPGRGAAAPGDPLPGPGQTANLGDPGTLRGPNAPRPGDTLKVGPPNQPPLVEPVRPGGGQAPVEPVAGTPTTATGDNAGTGSAAPSCARPNWGQVRREAAKGGLIDGAVTFAACMVAKQTPELQKLTVGDCLVQAGWAALDGAQIGAIAVLAPQLVPILVAVGLWQTTQTVNELIDELGKIDQAALDELRALKRQEHLISQTAMNSNLAACDYRVAWRLAQMLRSRPPEPLWLPTIWPNVEKGARAQIAVDKILVDAETSSDDARKNQLFDQARAAAEGVPCLLDRIGKAAACNRPPAPPQTSAACPAGGGALTEVFELCGPEQFTGRLVCYGNNTPYCEDGSPGAAFASFGSTPIPVCGSKGKVWMSTSQSQLCGDVSKPGTCGPAECRAPGANERAWTCSPSAAKPCPTSAATGLQAAAQPSPPSAEVAQGSPGQPSPPSAEVAQGSPGQPSASPEVAQGLQHQPSPAPEVAQGSPDQPAQPRVSGYPPPSGAPAPQPQPPITINMPPVHAGGPPPQPRINMPPVHSGGPHSQPRVNVNTPPVHSGGVSPQPPTQPHVNIYTPPPQSSQPAPQPMPGHTGSRSGGSCHTAAGQTTCTDLVGNKCVTTSSYCDPNPAQAKPGPQAALPTPKPLPPAPVTPQQPSPRVAGLPDPKPMPMPPSPTHTTPAPQVAALPPVEPPSCQRSATSFYPARNESVTVTERIAGGGICMHNYTHTALVRLTGASVTTYPGNGRLTQTGTYDFKYEPRAGFKGSDSYKIRVCGQDKRGRGCSTLTYAVTVR